MAIEDYIPDLIIELGRIGKWIQAIGLVIVLWVIFQIIILINNRVKRKKLYSIESRLENIEKKLNKLIKRK